MSKKIILNEEFKRMLILAGIKLNENLENELAYLRDLEPDTKYQVRCVMIGPSGEKEIDNYVISVTQEEIDKEPNLSIQNYINSMFQDDNVVGYKVLSAKDVKKL